MSKFATDKNRERLSLALIVLAAVALTAATLAFYVKRNVFEPARFADHAQATLESPAVRQIAADKITRDVIEQVDPDAVAVRPLISGATAAVIDTTAFKRLFRSAVLEAHRSAVENRLDNAVLVLANIGVLVEQSLRRLSPDVADQIPVGFDASLIRIAEGSWESEIATTANRTQRLAWLLPLVSLMLCALALIVARRRRHALWRVSVSVAVVGAALVVAYAFARSLVIYRFAEGTDRDAAEALWQEFMRGFLYLSAGLATAGSALAAAASGTLRSTDIDARARELLVAAVRPPVAPLRRIVWALALILVGVWAMIDPLALARTAGFFVGFLLVFRGANELISLSMPDGLRVSAAEARESAGAAGRASFSRRFAVFAATIAVVFVAAAAIGAAMIGEEGLQRIGVIADTRSCNGAERLCGKRFDEVTFAATHNSMSDQSYAGGWLFPEQDGPVSQQLAAGVRGLMIDVYYGFPGTRVYTDGDLSSPGVRNALYDEFGREFVAAADRIRRTISKPEADASRRMFLCHGFCELGATPIEETFSQIREFLDDNPREVLAIVFQDYVPTADLAAEIEKAGLGDVAYKGPLGPPWPTLEEMIEDAGRVLMLTERNTSPAVPWIHPAFTVMQETPFGFKNSAALAARASCEPGRGEQDSSIFLINHWIETAPAARPSNARRANSRDVLLPRIERCQKKRDRRANLIAVDFYEQGDLVAVTDELNGVE